MDKKRIPVKLVTLQFAVCALLAFQSAGAIEIISNMPGNDGTSTFINGPVGGSNGGGAFNSKAAGFTMPGSAYNLDFVTLRLEFFTTTSAPIVHIYDDVGGNPTNILHTLIPPAPVVGIDNFVFASGGFVLNASTTYWMVIWNDTPFANSFRWLASVPSVTPTGIATSAGYRFSNGPPPPTGNSTTLNSYSVNATLVPEPASIVALGIGGVLLLLRRRK